MRKILPIVILGILFCFGVSEVSADFYVTIDENGKRQFTNTPKNADYDWYMRENRAARPTVGKTGKSYASYDEIIKDVSLKYGVDAALIKAMIKAESDFNPYAMSSAGAQGLMQLMPQTAKTLGVRNVFDPYENVNGGVKHLRRLLTLFGWNIKFAVAAYNAGENTVLKYGGVPPYNETRTYVKRVLRFQKEYRELGV